jgi:polar amino acid transport system ATP-binding protein
MGTEQPLISVRGLSKSYDGVQVLKEIDLTIEQGDLVSIIGPSGCGKSTLLRCLNCLEILDRGAICIAGIRLARETRRTTLDTQFQARAHALREQVGMVFQNPNLFSHKTLLENVMLAPMVVKGESREVAEAKALKLLDKVGLLHYKDRYPSKISGGQQQRGGIARALAMSPQVMLYDEPTLSLDPGLVDEVLQVMRDLDQEGMTQIVVTHEMDFARNASDYIVYMEKGEVVEISDEDEIFIAPRDPRTRRFLTRYCHDV